jgi:hypothetical protein
MSNRPKPFKMKYLQDLLAAENMITTVRFSELVKNVMVMNLNIMNNHHCIFTNVT